MEEVFLRITHGDYNRGPGGAVGNIGENMRETNSQVFTPEEPKNKKNN